VPTNGLGLARNARSQSYLWTIAMGARFGTANASRSYHYNSALNLKIESFRISGRGLTKTYLMTKHLHVDRPKHSTTFDPSRARQMTIWRCTEQAQCANSLCWFLLLLNFGDLHRQRSEERIVKRSSKRVSLVVVRKNEAEEGQMRFFSYPRYMAVCWVLFLNSRCQSLNDGAN